MPTIFQVEINFVQYVEPMCMMSKKNSSLQENKGQWKNEDGRKKMWIKIMGMWNLKPYIVELTEERVYKSSSWNKARLKP